MAEFWETAFNDKQEMWGMKAAQSAEITSGLFREESLKNILIPGIGYGRNAQPFIEDGMSVEGIEISPTAVELTKKHFGDKVLIYQGSVSEMPFSDTKYDGVFCYALIHLLDKEERKNLIRNCYNQLGKSGFMVFTAVTKDAPNYGKGKFIEKDRYEFHAGAKIFYYDQESLRTEFSDYGLFDVIQVKEEQPMYLIKCKKEY